MQKELDNLKREREDLLEKIKGKLLLLFYYPAMYFNACCTNQPIVAIPYLEEDRKVLSKQVTELRKENEELIKELPDVCLYHIHWVSNQHL